MKPWVILSLFIAFATSTYAQEKLLSPDDFLGYPLGARFTPHHRIASYFRHVASANPSNVKLMSYGETQEGRPLMLAFVSSAENLARLEEIRTNNLRLAGLSGDDKPPVTNGPVVVWLSYNVHGNEPSSSEAAMKTLHALADPSLASSAQWLKHVMVIIDPCVNPDGRDRYVNWFNGVTGIRPDADPASREHREPWPGGRVNHYGFDLNRDWAWQTQRESRQRVQIYNQWMPQVVVDFHEQGFNSPYYFAPAAEPYHEVVTPWQREFQVLVGRNNARLFDAQGWLYFTKERFDLFYPSYGDTYPTYNGAIGMTFEQGGGPRGGLAVIMSSGDTLTLADRLEHHFTTGLSTIDVVVQQRDRLMKEYRKFFVDAANGGSGLHKTYIIKADASGSVTPSVKRLLENNGIDFGYASSRSPAKGYRYLSGKEEAFQIEPGDLILSAYQPRSNMLRVLFEPRSRLTDSVTYDITAWAIPYAMGLDAFAMKEKILPAVKGNPLSKLDVQTIPDSALNALAYAIPWNGKESAGLLVALMRRGVKVRAADKAFSSQGKDFPAGTLLVAKTSNGGGKASLLSSIMDAARDCGGLPGNITPIYSGFMDKGSDLGSNHYPVLNPPRIALLSGDGVRPGSMGEIWQLFEQEIKYPITLIPAVELNVKALKGFDVLIIPNGNYRLFTDKVITDGLKGWVQEGGRIIAIENAVAQLSNIDWAIKRKKDAEKKNDVEIGDKGYNELRRYEDREREEVSGSIPGAVYQLGIDNSHPLAYGFPSWYYTLKLDEGIYSFFKDDGWNVGYLKKDDPSYGFIGNRSKQKIVDGLLFGVQDLGAGHVVYLADDVTFRNFWEKGKLMLCNAVFQLAH